MRLLLSIVILDDVLLYKFLLESWNVRFEEGNRKLKKMIHVFSTGPNIGNLQENKNICF